MYESLNDAIQAGLNADEFMILPAPSDPNHPLGEGETEIWYMKPDWFSKGLMQENPQIRFLETTHVLLGTIKCVDLEQIYMIMQSEIWSPQGEASSLIRSKELQHTSMSVGDIVKVDGKIHIVRMSGFEELNRCDQCGRTLVGLDFCDSTCEEMYNQ